MRTTLCLLPLLLAGCAAITTGRMQNVAVQTSPTPGAECELRNDKGAWLIPQTPGTVTLERSYSDLTITCRSGAKLGVVSIPSRTKNVAFGNVFNGVVIGSAIDTHSGAAFDYPALITVPLASASDQPVQLPVRKHSYNWD